MDLNTLVHYDVTNGYFHFLSFNWSLYWFFVSYLFSIIQEYQDSNTALDTKNVKGVARLKSQLRSEQKDKERTGATRSSIEKGLKNIVTLIPEHEQESIPYDNNSIDLSRRRKS